MDQYLIKLWQFSLWFLCAVVSILMAPASLIVSSVVGGLVVLTKHRARVRHDRYSWSYHRPGRPRKSGYRRARHGIFA